MEQYVGLDVFLKEISVCVADADGAVVYRSLHRQLERLSLQIICIDASPAYTALSAKLKKSDKADAEGAGQKRPSMALLNRLRRPWRWRSELVLCPRSSHRRSFFESSL